MRAAAASPERVISSRVLEEASTHCRHYLVVEHDDSVYPCDFHVRPELKLGNVMTDTWDAMSNSNLRCNFANAKCRGLPDKCMQLILEH